MRGRRLALGLAALSGAVVLALGPLGLAVAGADTTLVGYNASSLAVGSQFAFNVPNVLPLPNENIIEEDAPFSRTTVGGGPVVDSISAPYYPGDIAADLGSLLLTFGAPDLPLNDPLLAETKYPTSPGYTGHKTFGVAPADATPLLPSIFSAESDASVAGGDGTATLSSLALDTLGVTKSIPIVGKLLGGSTGTGPSSSGSLVDVGNISTSTNVSIGASAVTSTATSEVNALDIAGLIDIAGLTSTASATSDGTTGTPTASLHLGQVTVDGVSAYIDNTGVHLGASSTAKSGLTPAQLQQTVDATLSQDGISIRVLDPQLTSTGPGQASADAGGLVIAIAHQFDVPFIPGEPTIPVPELGNVGLPAGLYTATTSITFGLAQASVSATALTSAASLSPTTTSLGTGGTGSSLGTLGTSDLGGGLGSISPLGSSAQSLAPTGPGSAPAVAAPAPSSATDFPIRGVPPPLGWSIAAIVAAVLLAYPLLLLARWQFVAGRRP
jgi:hypothetical protein